jgi:transcriptional regulator with XRE-family HTH domain
MKAKVAHRHHRYDKLGSCLKEARGDQSIADVARHLQVTLSFVYQVEKGDKKPKDRDIGKWASVYGVKPTDLWKCLHRIPMDLVSTLKAEPEPVPVDPFSQLTEEEKSELRPFLDFVRWKITQQASKVK